MQQITDLTSIILIVGEDKLCPQVPKGHPLHHQPYKDLAETVTCCGLCWARGVDTAVRSQWSYEQDHFYFVCTVSCLLAPVLFSQLKFACFLLAACPHECLVEERARLLPPQSLHLL